MLEKLLKKNRRPATKFDAFFTLTAVTLSACGGRGKEETAPTTINGSVLKGQITNALVFSDINTNGVFDASEPSAYTDENGKFKLSTRDASAKLIALGQVGSIDKSTGASVENIVFSGSSSGTVISPFSTVITESGITSKELADSLGLGYVDLLNFNAFAEGVDAAVALLVENTSHQLENVINSFTETTKGSGLTAGQAKKTALESFAALVKEKLALKETLDLSSDKDVAALSENVTKSMTLTVAEAEILKTRLDSVSTALINVNTEIKKIADLTSDTTKGVFSLGQLLKDQIVDSISKASNIDLVDSAKVELAAANLAPNDLKITSTKIAENTSDLVVGTFSAIDEDPGSIIYSLAGTDAPKFSLSDTAVLSLNSAANYEAQKSYALVLKVEDTGGKKSASKFQIVVENVNDAATGLIEIKGSAERLEVLIADISKITDEDSPNLASIAKYQWLRNGEEIEGATSKELTLSQAEVGKLISVSLNYTDGSGTRETMTSNPTNQVEQVVSIGAVSLQNQGTSTDPILNFYLERTISEEQTRVSSIDFVLKFKPDQVKFENFQSNSDFTGVLNSRNISDGQLIYAGYSITGASSLEPLFTMNMQDLDDNAKFDIILEDLFVNNQPLDGSTFLIA